MLKSPKTSTLADGLIKRTSSMLDEIASKIVHKDKVTDIGKRSKTMNKVKPIENINKNLLICLEISAKQKEALLLHKLQVHAYQ